MFAGNVTPMPNSTSPGAVTNNIAIEAARAFLARHPPFDRLDADTLAWIAGRLALGYYPKGTTIIGFDAPAAEWLYIVQRGAVAHRPSSDKRLGADDFILGPGEVFPFEQLLHRQSPNGRFDAVADTFCYQLPAADCAEAIMRSPRLRAYALDHFDALLRDARQALALTLAARSHDEQRLERPLRSLVRRPVVQCRPQASVEAALRVMHDARVGSILIIDEQDRLLGILTRHDVLDRIALARCDLSRPVTDVMTPDPRWLDAQESAHQAATLIAREGFRHIPIVAEGRVIGVVTERDLFALQHASLRGVRRAIAEATSVEALATAARQLRALARRTFEQGVLAEPLTHIVTTLNDAIAARAIAIERAACTLPAIPWCWLAFGSEGRYEQTISTDQDNGILFDAPTADAERVREAFFVFGRRVNVALDACGFPLCKGEIMAGNPKWCLSLAEWSTAFARWIELPEPRELLYAAIFFDFRALDGEVSLAARLRTRLGELVAANPAFIRQLAAFAVETRPPLGLLGGFNDDDARHPGTMDLKGSAARFFIDSARVFGLAAGVEATNTAERLRASAGRLRFNEKELHSAVDAFWFVQGLRLRAQLAAIGTAEPNRIALSALSEVEARTLKESLRQARSLQLRLMLDYRL
jgi:CBS domain-containing protein